jgi:hypothetical protein
MNRLSRRTAIQRGAIVAGVAWTAPVVKSVRLLQASGSPPPSSSTTTEPSGPTTVDISGAITGTLRASSFTPPFTPLFFHYDGTITVPGIGDGTFTFDATVTTEEVVEGPITVTFAAGTLVGDLFFTMPVAQGIPMRLNFTSGTGNLAGATGHADGFIAMVSQSSFFTLDGSVTGTLDLP